MKDAVRLENQLAKATSTDAKEHAKLKVQIQEANKASKQRAKEALGLVTIYQKESATLIKLRKDYKNVALAQGENSKEAKRLLAQITPLDAKLKQLDRNVGQGQRSVGLYNTALGGLKRGFTQLAGALGVTGLLIAFVNVVKSSISTIVNFQKQNAVLASVLNKSRDEISELTKDAQRLGAITAKSATEVNKLQVAYARLGFTQSEILNLTEDTINGSIALNAELSETAELTGAMVRTFDDLSTTDAGLILDQLTASTQLSALNFDKLRTALPIVAGAANAAGVSFSKTVSLLGKLSDAGIDASSSATALRNIFIESASQGLSYEEILSKISSSQDKLTVANDEFGKRGAVSAAILANLSDEVNNFDESLQNAGGTASRVAATQLDTLDGKITLLKSAWEGLILTIDSGDGSIGRFFRGGIEFATDFINALSNVDLLIDVLGKDLDELSNKQINKLLDLGLETDSGKEVKDFFTTLESLPIDEVVANVSKFRDEFVKALTDEGESLEESTRIFEAWFSGRKAAFEAQNAFDFAISRGVKNIEDFNDRFGKSILAFENGEEKLKIIKKLYDDYTDSLEATAKAQEDVRDSVPNLKLLEPAKRDINATKEAYNDLLDFLRDETGNSQSEIEAEQKEFLKRQRESLEEFARKEVEIQKKTSDEKLKIKKEEEEKAKIIRDTSFEAVAIIGNQLFENGRINSENELKRLQDQKAFELELAGDNSQRRAQIEEDFARKENAIRKKQAKRDKQQAIFNIALNTARGITAALTSIPPNVPLSIAIGAIGAVQAAAVASRPLPAFEKGGIAPGGPIITSEKGEEMAITPEGRLIMTGNKGAEVRTDIPRGSEILNHSITKDILRNGFDHNEINQDSAAKIWQVIRMEKDRTALMLSKKMERETDILRASIDKSIGSIEVHKWGLVRGEIEETVEKGRTRRSNWVSKNMD